MLTKLYEKFILDCIKYLEENPLYSEKLQRLKKIIKAPSNYLGVMTEALLVFFYRNDHYRSVSHIYNGNEEKDAMFMVDTLLEVYEKMCNTYLFDVSLDGFDPGISRTIQVPHDATLGSLGLAIIASLGGQYHEFYMSQGVDGLYPAYYDQELHFTESDPFEEYLSGFRFGNERLEMKYYGLTIGIQLREIQQVEDIRVPQSYKVLGGTGLNLCIRENEDTFSAKIISGECSCSVPMDISEEVKRRLIDREAYNLVPLEDDECDEWEE